MREYDWKDIDTTTIIMPEPSLVYYIFLYFLDKKNKKIGALKKDLGNISVYSRILGRSEVSNVSKTASR